jgi:hypothetical protein
MRTELTVKNELTPDFATILCSIAIIIGIFTCSGTQARRITALAAVFIIPTLDIENYVIA